MDADAFRQAIEAELEGNLLPFWRHRSLDGDHGGFLAEMANDGTLRPKAAKGLILNARILWTFSTLFSERHDPADLATARRAYEWLEEHMRDTEHGGYLWCVDPEGKPLDATKKIYGQAFVIYALAAYAETADEPRALLSARELFELIETHAWDDANGGYFEARASDWSDAGELRLSSKDMVAAKSMNTHLHVLEAYTGLYRMWPEPRVAGRLRELIGLFERHILDRDRRHLHHFFDREWNVLSDTYTYGHDIEAAWLLCEAAGVLGDAGMQKRVTTWAVSIACATQNEGIDADGALSYEGRAGTVIDPNREWWCQAEAVVGFWQARELTGEAVFAETAAGIWSFIERQVVDREHGEWHWRIFADGSPDLAEPKVSTWKGPYHNVRMCLEMLRRIDATAEEGSR